MSKEDLEAALFFIESALPPLKAYADANKRAAAVTDILTAAVREAEK